jgi:predicted transposase/invertase (TIGR01784 family)
MSLGIKPTVDFAFKKIFGSPENAAALIGLLNAILNFPRPIVAVEILNPFSYQEFAESKLIVLDVRCRDSESRWLNVEMQVSVYAGLLERLVSMRAACTRTNCIKERTMPWPSQRSQSVC